ncbi:2343_t:CDS:1, partial [Acaulospora colombiana]
MSKDASVLEAYNVKRRRDGKKDNHGISPVIRSFHETQAFHSIVSSSTE